MSFTNLISFRKQYFIIIVNDRFRKEAREEAEEEEEEAETRTEVVGVDETALMIEGNHLDYFYSPIHSSILSSVTLAGQFSIRIEL